MATNKGLQCDVVTGIMVGLAWLFFSLRIYVRAFITRSWKIEDLFLTVGMLFFTANAIALLLGVKYGIGTDYRDYTSEVPYKGFKFVFLNELFYTLTGAVVRLSISMFIIRICSTRLCRIIVYATMTIVVAYSTIYFFVLLFQCSPVSFYWNQFNGGSGSCLNRSVVIYTSVTYAVVSFISDWVLGLLPIVLIWNLQLNWGTKISLAAILSLALIAGIANIIRIPYLIIRRNSVHSYLYMTADVAICSIVEAGLGTIAASAYTLRPLFRSVYSSFSKSTLIEDPNTATTSGHAGHLQDRNHNRNQNNSSNYSSSDQDISLSPISTREISSVHNLEDSHKDVSQMEQGASSEAGYGIRIYRSFEITIRREEESDA